MGICLEEWIIMELQKVVTTQELAESLKCSPKTIRKNYCLTGHCYGIRPIKIGARLLWPVADIAKLLAGELSGALSDRVCHELRRSHEL